jgi:PhnB protein
MELNTYLGFNGCCEEAFTFYAETLGGTIAGVFRFGGSPMEGQVPADWKDKVMHATLTFGNATLMGSDNPPGHYEPTKGVALSVGVAGVEEAERVFAALSKGGKVTMPLQQTFWAPRFGMLEDRFGIPWMVNCESEGQQ